MGAHVTLFHAIPGELAADVATALSAQAVRAFDARVTGVRSLGRGAAYTVESAELARRHRILQEQWWPHLTRQDQQPLRAHVTVQNKVDPDTARHTVAALTATFTPFDLDPVGYDLWRYDGGPWTHLTRAAFP